MMYKYAAAHDIVDKDYASVVSANGSPIKRERTKEPIPFTDEEVQQLWDNKDLIPFADMVLIGIYSGWQPQELSILQIADIDIENRMREANALQSEYLFNDVNGQQGTYMTYDKYRKRFQKVMDRLKIKHRPHETRHTFLTKAKSCIYFMGYLLGSGKLKWKEQVCYLCAAWQNEGLPLTIYISGSPCKYAAF